MSYRLAPEEPARRDPEPTPSRDARRDPNSSQPTLTGIRSTGRDNRPATGRILNPDEFWSRLGI